MAGKIALLSDEVIGKIAAGEVVERPSAAIKELVENSLDAGATAVTVEIRDGGISYFRVTDNGSGIRAEDIRMAFERHATSKIRRTDDLFSIATLGFRGEALASIAAVAHVTCTTRTKNDISGLKVQNNGGVIESIEEAACPEGTTFVVRNLFFNTPVRLKFLKKPVTEAGYVSDLMMRLILSRPDVSFRYVSQGKTLYHSAGDGKLSSAVFSIYGREMLQSMREVNGHQSGLILKGFVGVGDSGRGSRNHQSFFINGRFMKSGILSAAVEAACRERVLNGKYPTCVLHLTMPYDTVDVNVHPNKLEVRFQNEAAVAEAVERIVADALRDEAAVEQPEVMRLTPQMPVAAPVTVVKQEVAPRPETSERITQDTPKPLVPPKQPVVRTDAVQQDTAVAQKDGATAMPVREQLPKLEMHSPVAATQMRTVPTVPPMQAVPEEKRPLVQPSPAAKPMPATEPSPVTKPSPVAKPLPVAQAQTTAPKKPSPAEKPTPVQQRMMPEETRIPMRIIGTLFDSYILVEYQQSLLMIDQQAVHERMLFDRMMKALDQQRCGQEMLVPLIVSLTRREQQLLAEHQAELEAIGLVVEPFGENEVSIRSIPMILGQPQAAGLLRDIIDQLEGERGVVSLEKRRAAILALACKRSVRQGDKLNEGDIAELVSRVVDRHVIPASPRGTPLVVALNKLDIDRRFRRMQ